ncbi:RNA-directed DNA polymerase like [Apostasia shenzhenica]|uniref:RNA-directed DNA polymerase like n=1 Tax=Apostasia shenzhenica TaxID=1088818 RepID=A0A2I0BCF2_9ASPA|nr:RNA-directed DNA polymerase like [Apostasia shenzhenica]
MCIDLRALNQACPKDTYPLPRIDMMVDQTSGYSVMSFLDAFSGYHQIQMAKEDAEKIAYHRLWHLLLQCYALRSQKCWRDIPAHD